MPSYRPAMIRRPAAWLLVALLTAVSAQAQPLRLAPAPEGCGETHNQYGPFDYRTSPASQRYLVEHAHFTHGVETLTKGSTGPFGNDIGYTLAVFPNHPRAILTVERLAAREKADPPPGTDMSIECYYARGMSFAPDDLVFRMLYASYLTRRNRLDEAQKFLAFVVDRAGESPLTHFNAGLLYFDMKDYDRALAQAHRAMALGMTRTDLSDQLKKVGRWQEPTPPQSPASAPVLPVMPASSASQPSR